jgi:hypothetical protein
LMAMLVVLFDDSGFVVLMVMFFCWLDGDAGCVALAMMSVVLSWWWC